MAELETPQATDLHGGTPEAESFTIRRKVIKFFGAGFHIYDATGQLVGYCKQKAFRIREDIRIYTDETLADELMRISTTSVLDIAGLYMVEIPDAGPLGGFRRKAMKSMLRDTWEVVNPEGQHIATIQEESGFKAFARRVHEGLATLMPQKYILSSLDGSHIATYQRRFNPVVHKLDVTVHNPTPKLVTLLLIAGGCLLSAIEGRQ
ncbi:MAG: LURP-one-related/scramblase family protein [Planctomycetota bacterium]|jgi:hypothetical protein